MNGTEKRKRKNPRRDLEAVAIRHSQCLGGEKVVNFDPFFSSENNNLRWTNGRGNLCPFCARGNIYELRKVKAYSSFEGCDSLRFSHSLCK